MIRRFQEAARRLDQRGVSTVEFAIVLPAFLMVMIGGMHLTMLGFTSSSLHYAVEAGARCARINTTTCTNQTTTQTFAATQFKNITGATPTFSANSSAVCGYQVSGTVSYTLKTGISSLTVPLSATACYPT